MAGRGRGGRGRGRAAMSFNVEQLGFNAGEALPGPVLQPPPVYPIMENRPIALQGGVEGEYMLALKREFVEFLRESPAFVMPAVAKAEIERYSDRYQVALANKSHGELKFDWSRFPPELRPVPKVTGKRKRLKKKNNNKPKDAKIAKKAVDITTRLEELEKKEEQQSDNEAEGDEAEGKEEEEEKEGEGEEGAMEDIEEEDLDEEMDEGTDYINSYFDNGENYLDEEDDNLDDGPIY